MTYALFFLTGWLCCLLTIRLRDFFDPRVQAERRRDWIESRRINLESCGIPRADTYHYAQRAWEVEHGCICKSNEFGATQMGCPYKHFEGIK